ncbi:hypothetical protein GCM10007920_14630 [Ciceribacter naphthalenivorans]|uniref:Uncharacterized protein n=2 Tax=Alphaproteobacteria TaxID=28211 RepID=A0A512HK59_9HYPH|nr:hypothetical protein RNA01_27530 [Ciceribacter naphthalenivorans]GLR21677.1 hypothetical protein GCM10007920_14630 [Ciceribacter naphthalenivorans]GLT04533.1 hypothetical protein GCM10007926_14630 [Sphingomonas psychrolutea]
MVITEFSCKRGGLGAAAAFDRTVRRGPWPQSTSQDKVAWGKNTCASEQDTGEPETTSGV